MSINEIKAAINDLETKMNALDSKKSWFGSNSIFAKWRNGRAARSAAHLTNLLTKLNTSKEENMQTLQQIHHQAIGLFAKNNQLLASKEFHRTTWFCIPRDSNTRSCLSEATRVLYRVLRDAGVIREENGSNALANPYISFNS